MRHQLPLLWITILLFSCQSQAQSSALKSPNVSADTILLYRHSNFGADNASLNRNGFDIQEAEVALYTDVDPYSWMNVILSVHPQYTLNKDTGKVEETWSVEPEELFLESEYFPALTLKAGKFKAAFGKHNTLHTHVYPFVDAPMINTRLLGEEGLNDAGVSAAYLLPTGWYSEVTAEYLRGAGENNEFNSESPNDGVGLGHWKNLFDLNDSLTMEAGVSYAGGPNDVGGDTTLTGADLTFKWRPSVGGLYRSAILASEYIGREQTQSAGPRERAWGLANWFQYQWTQRWSAKVRYEFLKVRDSLTAASSETDALANGDKQGISLAVDFNPTEFSYFRLEYDANHGPIEPSGPPAEINEQRVYLQANFVIGSHPAHTY